MFGWLKRILGKRRLQGTKKPLDFRLACRTHRDGKMIVVQYQIVKASRGCLFGVSGDSHGEVAIPVEMAVDRKHWMALFNALQPRRFHWASDGKPWN